ncbi:MAG: hypothetical protein JWQ89_1043 [Devosia sp.]|uniref:hypothetical protein n=1 Tax=Devosia sp. TaxID=1871048 RepID=UPI00263755ED|nr:hypothetical protein [Devosia sp.]MDB5539316.1 hypothetical protein [Devosia sp.]
MRTLLAALAVIALSSGAQAYCFPIPDTVATGYVDNQMHRTLCIQRKMSQAADARKLATEFDAALGRVQRDLQQQKVMLQQQQSQLDALYWR